MWDEGLAQLGAGGVQDQCGGGRRWQKFHSSWIPFKKKKHFRASGFAWGFAFAVVVLFVGPTCVYTPPPAPHSQTKYRLRAN